MDVYAVGECCRLCFRLSFLITYSCSMSVPGAVRGPPMQPLALSGPPERKHKYIHKPSTETLPDQVDGGQLKHDFSFRNNLWWVEILIKFQIYDKRIVFMQHSIVESYENKLWNEIKFKNILRDINFYIKLNFICKWNRIINIIKIITKGTEIWWTRASSSVQHIYLFIHSFIYAPTPSCGSSKRPRDAKEKTLKIHYIQWLYF